MIKLLINAMKSAFHVPHVQAPPEQKTEHKKVLGHKCPTHNCDADGLPNSHRHSDHKH